MYVVVAFTTPRRRAIAPVEAMCSVVSIIGVPPPTDALPSSAAERRLRDLRQLRAVGCEEGLVGGHVRRPAVERGARPRSRTLDATRQLDHDVRSQRLLRRDDRNALGQVVTGAIADRDGREREREGAIPDQLADCRADGAPADQADAEAIHVGRVYRARNVIQLG